MRQAYFIAGMGYGDEGKGTITDYCCKLFGADLVVRYNGGCQAAHNVVTDTGLHHTFSQFGSGTLRGIPTHLSRYMVVDPISLANEAAVLMKKGISNPYAGLTVSPEALIVTPAHVIANRIREVSRGDRPHGSTGMGIGEARADEEAGVLSLRAFDLKKDNSSIRSFLRAILEHKVESMDMHKSHPCFGDFKIADPDLILPHYEDFRKHVRLEPDEEKLARHSKVVFEGAQGFLIDQKFGFAPYNSYTNITFQNAEKLVLPHRQTARPIRIGVIRSFYTRHGTGPFVTEDINLKHDEKHNGHHRWMGSFRLGHFDSVALRYANRVLDVDCLAVTHLDAQLSGKACVAYMGSGGMLIENLYQISPRDQGRTKFAEEARPIYEDAPDIGAFLSQMIPAPIRIRSFGPASKHKCHSLTPEEIKLWEACQF